MTLVWIISGLLAFTFLMTGFMKLAKTKRDLKSMGMNYVDDLSQGQLHVIGVLEILGAIGLILPRLLTILPVLSFFAGIGLALIMIGAAITHARRGEYAMIMMNLVLFLLAVFVAYSLKGLLVTI